ncbi:MAG: CHAT domain-containing protein, partial [Flavobacterium sp.]|nr:CHAT domain-containing protein [Pedobacter sp.]
IDYKAKYNQAELLSNAEKSSNKTDSLALKGYSEIIQYLSKNKSDNPFLFKANIAAGSFCQVLDRQRDALRYFQNAINLKRNLLKLKDSILFKPLVYAGNAFYKLDQIDSAEYCYKEAEKIAGLYPQVDEKERLYNTLGVLSYTVGDYTKSITYYQKAIAILQAQSSKNSLFLVTYKSNLASALKKLKRYDEALKIYKELLPYHILPDRINHNIAAVYLAQGDSKNAQDYLLKVTYTDQKKLNDLGYAYVAQKNYSKAIFYLQKAIELNKEKNGNRKNPDFAKTLKILGDTYIDKNEIVKALRFYQKAINNLQLNFNSVNIYHNPEDFTTIYSSSDLMATLLAKAAALQLLYSRTKRISHLETSLQTYFSFYRLADLTARIYNSDESRMLINTRKYSSHQRPIAIALELFRLTGKEQFKEMAFRLDEENKANVLALSLEETNFKSHSGISVGLLRQEAQLKHSITNYSLKAANETDSAALNKISNLLRESTLELFKVQEKISEQSAYQKLKYAKVFTDLSSFQKMIPDKGAVLSYHLGDSNLICFLITSSEFKVFDTPITPTFLTAVKQLYHYSKLREGNPNSQIRSLSQILYGKLIKPTESSIGSKTSLMIIPDDELNFVPFELLKNTEGENLINHFDITYNYSCSILKDISGLKNQSEKQMAMAPFGKMEGNWAALPASAGEILAVKGSHFYNQEATKQAFLKNAPSFGIIHLATHAYANDKASEKSFIAFYPSNLADELSYKLYLPEIYNLKLNHTRLVILSACETGNGQLVDGEGIMSLSRAFFYAGCPNIITSMWKADDYSTAYLSKRLHFYLQEGYSASVALQKSKLEYLNDGQISPSEKLPGYWGHLRLIGGFETQTNSSIFWVLYLPLALIIFLVGIFITKKAALNSRRLNI